MPSSGPPNQNEQTQFAVLLFTDICDSTALKAKHGALTYKAAAELHNALFERLAADEQLTLIKNTGDGYFARTTSVAAAVRFALCLQHHLRTMAWPSFPLVTRVGIHAGEVANITTLGQTDVLAPAADLVARVMSLAVGGQILLTRGPFDEARHFVREYPGVAEGVALTWLAHGPYLFKGCEEPVDVFEVGLTGCAPLVAPPDGEKAKRALRPGDEETLGWRPAEGLEIPGRPGWRIAGKLGAGGFGEVWAGERDKTHERRAFKFCFDAERLRALKREVTLTRLLRETLGEREDIVRIYELRLDEPPYFLESEFATDGNLLQWAERQGGLDKIPLTDRIELVAATAAAIGAAHSVGVLHKDIKPTNVLIFTGKDGRARPRLVDFGIGTLADSSVLAQHGITGAGFTGATIKHSSGTPTYSPPEYLAGKPFTMQGDVYSLGVMLWQLVTGKADAPLAEGWQRDVPDELLREDIAACVDGDPARRLPSALEVTARLRALPERRTTRERERAAAALEAARRKRQRTLIFATTTALIITAIAVPLALWALKAQRDAVAAKNAVTKFAAKLETSEKELEQKLHEASMADYSVAVERFERDGKWPEGVAYLARALKWWPENPLAATRLYSTLALHIPEKQTWPRKILQHEKDIQSAQFSPDGKRILTVSASAMKVWDADSGSLIGEPMQPESSVSSVQFSPDGKHIITASSDNTVQDWNADTGKELRSPMHFGHGEDFSKRFFSDLPERFFSDLPESSQMQINPRFSLDLTRVLTESDKSLRVWNTTTGKPCGVPIRREGHIREVEFNADGTRILTRNDDTVQVWDVASGMALGETMRHEQSVQSAQFSREGTRILTCSNETARVWDATDGKQLGATIRPEEGVQSVRFSLDGARIITVSRDHTARVWDAITGKQLGAPMRDFGDLKRTEFSPCGTRIATVSLKTVQIWHIGDNSIYNSIYETSYETSHETSLGHAGQVISVDFSPDGARIVTVARDFHGFKSELRVWDAFGNALGEPLKGCKFAQFSPDGARILTTSLDGTAEVWDVPSGKVPGEPVSHEGGVMSARFSPDGKRVLTTQGKTAQVWDIASREAVGAPLRIRDEPHTSRFSPDGTRILTCGGKIMQMWNAAAGEALGKPMRSEGYVARAQFSPDNTRIVTQTLSETSKIELWDADSGKPIGEPLESDHTFWKENLSFSDTRFLTVARGGVQVWDTTSGKACGEPLEADPMWAEFNSDGTRILTTNREGQVEIRDTISRRKLALENPLRSEGGVYRAHYSPDDRRVLTVSRNVVKVWDMASGNALADGMRHEETVDSAQFNADGTCILTVSGFSTARVWDAITGKQLGEPMPLSSRSTSDPEFSSDGRRIVTVNKGTALVWDISKLLHSPVPIPPWMIATAFSVAGMDFNADGELREISNEKRLEFILKPHAGDDEWSKLARWLAQPVNQRTLSPDSKFTCRQMAERDRDSGTVEGLFSALRYDPTVPLARILLVEADQRESAERKMEYESLTGESRWLVRNPGEDVGYLPAPKKFLREYDLKHLPNDASLWARAAVSLVAQKDFPLAIQAADKALALDPKNEEAQRARQEAQDAKFETE